MYSAPDLMIFIWPLLSLMTGALLVTASILLLRERGMASWLMVIGSGIGLIGALGSTIFLASLLVGLLSMGSRGIIMTALTTFAFGGHLLFAIGLLLHALQRRLLASRIAELEAIIASLHSR